MQEQSLATNGKLQSLLACDHCDSQSRKSHDHKHAFWHPKPLKGPGGAGSKRLRDLLWSLDSRPFTSSNSFPGLTLKTLKRQNVTGAWLLFKIPHYSHGFSPEVRTGTLSVRCHCASRVPGGATFTILRTMNGQFWLVVVFFLYIALV